MILKPCLQNPEIQKITRRDGLFDIFLAKLRRNVAKRLVPHTHRKGRVLDIGCGVYPFFLRNSEFSEKYAIDKAFWEEGDKFSNWRIRFVNCDIEKENRLPFDSEYFDVITMLAVFEHIEPEGIKRLLCEIRRILRNGGVFIMTTPAVWAGLLLKLMAGLKLVSTIGMEEHKATYVPSKICGLLKEAGFLEEKINFGYFEIFMNIWLTAGK